MHLSLHNEVGIREGRGGKGPREGQRRYDVDSGSPGGFPEGHAADVRSAEARAEGNGEEDPGREIAALEEEGRERAAFLFLSPKGECV